MENKVEVWKKHPDIEKIEVSSFGRVRSLKGCYYGINPGKNGYLRVSFRVNGKVVSKLVHRLVAETFINNPDNLPDVNHVDGNKTNNNAGNLKWCSKSQNIKYREKHQETLGVPVFAINLATLEVSRFQSQNEAGKSLGINRINIVHVIKGRQRKAHGYLFVTADNTAVAVAKRKLHKLGKTNLIATDVESAEFVSLVNAK